MNCLRRLYRWWLDPDASDATRRWRWWLMIGWFVIFLGLLLGHLAISTGLEKNPQAHLPK